MEVSKQASGSIVKSMTFKAVITCKDEKDRDVYNQCIEWRQLEEEKSNTVAALAAAAELSKSVVETSHGDDDPFGLNADRDEVARQSMSVVNVGAFGGDEKKITKQPRSQSTFAAIGGVFGIKGKEESDHEEGPPTGTPEEIYAATMRVRLAALTKETDGKAKTIQTLQEKLRHLTQERNRMHHALEENADKIGTFEQHKQEQEQEELHFERVSRSTIVKADFYEPEPDHFMSDLIDF